MSSKSYSSYLTRILWICAIAVFVVAEAEVILAFREIPNDHLFLGIGSKYFVPFLVTLPFVAGLNGYFGVRRHFSATDDQHGSISSILRQPLSAIIVSYTAIVCCVGPLSAVLRSLR
jgi:hypothetical protein